MLQHGLRVRVPAAVPAEDQRDPPADEVSNGRPAQGVEEQARYAGRLGRRGRRLVEPLAPGADELPPGLRARQSVGHACREALIDLAQEVYDPTKHTSPDGVTPSKTDADRQLQAYLNVELDGGSNEAARRHAKAALAFAEALQHRRTATFRDAALCAEATTSVINVIAIISGRRDP
jgi:hypothetical protein